jgi:hypothetical protein
MIQSNATQEKALHAEPRHATLPISSLALHLLADLDIDLEELGHAAVEAHGFAFVQVGFSVVGGDALGGAGLREAESIVSSVEQNESVEKGELPIEHVRDHLDLSLGCGNLLLGGELGATAEEERHVD